MVPPVSLHSQYQAQTGTQWMNRACDNELLSWLLLLCNKAPQYLLAYNHFIRLTDSVGQELTPGMAFLCSMTSMASDGKM